jgi:DNA-binding PadR family transcriptional regulator
MRDDIRQRGHGRWHGPGHDAPHMRERGRWGDRGPDRSGLHGFFGNRGHGRGGGHFGGIPGGGHGGRERLERGILRYVILHVLRDGPKHGYEIIKHLEEKTGGLYSPSPGTLYPTLQYLDDLGLVRSDQKDGRRVYELTDSGRAELEEHLAQAEGFWNRFRDRTPPGAGGYELNFLEDALHDLARTVRGGLRNVAYGGDPETIRRVRLALERCQNEVREIISQGASARSTVGDREGPEGADDLHKPEAADDGHEETVL